MAKAWYAFSENASNRKVAEAASAYAERLWREDRPRRDDMELAMRRYNSRGLAGLFAIVTPDKGNVSLNLTKQAVSTLVARIGSQRPRPRCLTTGADYVTRQRSKKLQMFLDLMYQVDNVYATGQLAFRDAALLGTGILHPYMDCNAGCIRVERVFPAELMVDQLDSLDGNPTIFVRVKFMTRTRFAEMAMDYTTASDIAEIPSIPPSELPASYKLQENGSPVSAVSADMDLIRVFELVKTAHYDHTGKLIPGRRVIAAGPVLCCHEDYECTESPYLVFYWCPPLRGFWGDSAAQEIRGPEREVNRLLQKIQVSMQLAGQPWVLAEKGSIQIPKLTDKPGLLMEYSTGTNPPAIVAHNPVSHQLVEQAMLLKSEAMAGVGLNELQISGSKPAGIESGRGLEQLGEEHSLRFRDVSQAYEQFIAPQLASRLVALARELDEELREDGRGGYKVKGKIGKEAVVVDWKSAGIAPDDLNITCWPASILPLTPAARAEAVERLVQSGAISPEEGLRLQDIPDLEHETSLVKADCELLEWQIDQLLTTSNEVAPSEAQNLAYALKRGTMALLEATRLRAPLAKLDRVRDFLSEVEALMTEATAKQADAVVAPPTGPAPMADVPGAAMQAGPAMAPGLPPGMMQ